MLSAIRTLSLVDVGLSAIVLLALGGHWIGGDSLLGASLALTLLFLFSVFLLRAWILTVLVVVPAVLVMIDGARHHRFVWFTVMLLLLIAQVLALPLSQRTADDVSISDAFFAAAIIAPVVVSLLALIYGLTQMQVPPRHADTDLASR